MSIVVRDCVLPDGLGFPYGGSLGKPQVEGESIAVTRRQVALQS
jgi:hypothetical protein